jgi:hypothetical protein
MAKIIFTRDEYNQLADHFDRLRQTMRRLTPSDWNKGDNPILKELTVKFLRGAPDFPDYEVHMNRRHLRMVEGYCLATEKRLKETIIPEYIKRGQKEDYVQQCRDMVARTQGIRAKIEVAL